MYDKTISKSKSDCLKVIAVIFMVVYHTFAFPDRIKNVQYISIWIFKDGRSIEQVLSVFGSICVPIFLFLSGYGLYIKYGENAKYKDLGKRIFNLLKNYWIIMFIFIGIGLINEKYKFNVIEFVTNFITLNSSYNREWWFLSAYIVLVFSYPFILKFINNSNIKKSLCFFIAVNIFGMVLIKLGLILGIKSKKLTFISNILVSQLIFNIGVLVSKYSIFDKITLKLKLNKSICLALSMLIILIKIVGINIAIIDEFVGLIFNLIYIYLLANIISENSVLSKFSKHSTNIWLIHSFFCYYLFQQLTFAPKYSILIVIWILTLSLVCSILVNKILNMISRFKILDNIEKITQYNAR